MAEERTDSMCAIYARLIERQLETDDPDMDKIQEKLDFIKEYCHTVGHAPGETPDHLEPYLYERDE